MTDQPRPKRPVLDEDQVCRLEYALSALSLIQDGVTDEEIKGALYFLFHGFHETISAMRKEIEDYDAARSGGAS